MGQYLATATKKNRSSAKGMATRRNNGTKNRLSIKDIFMSIFFGAPVKNGKSKNKN